MAATPHQLSLQHQQQLEEEIIVPTPQQQLNAAVASLLQNEAAVKTNAATLKPYREEQKRAKQHIENHLLNSKDDFVPIGSKFLVKENIPTLAPLTMDIVKFCYITFRMKVSGKEISSQEVDAFEQDIIAAQKQLGADANVKIKRKATKPISYLLRRN